MRILLSASFSTLRYWEKKSRSHFIKAFCFPAVSENIRQNTFLLQENKVLIHDVICRSIFTLKMLRQMAFRLPIAVASSNLSAKGYGCGVAVPHREISGQAGVDAASINWLGVTVAAPTWPTTTPAA